MRLTILAIVLSLVPSSLPAMELHWSEGDVQAFPEIRQPDGKHLANSVIIQRLEAGKLHASLKSHFTEGRTTEDIAVLKTQPELVQEKWTWTERKGSEILRQIEVDFQTGQADAMKMEDGRRKEWHEKLKIKPGQTFGGGGMSYAVKNLKIRLDHGEHITLNSVSYGPKPRTVDIEIYRGVNEDLVFGTHTIHSEKIVLHPQVPFIAKLFIKVPDFYLWVTAENPPAILRFQSPLQEASDPIIWTDSILSGGKL